jgi:MoxR-like ATPase
LLLIRSKWKQEAKEDQRAHRPSNSTDCFNLPQSRKNILMVGPSGCGKTHVAAMIAEALDLEFAAQSCSVGVSESNFVGWLLPTGTNGQFNHVVSSFLKLYENGGCFLIDEMDNADPNLLVFLNMALANKGFYLPQRFDNPEVKRHPDFVCVALLTLLEWERSALLITECS